MLLNFARLPLKLNQDKTKLVFISSRYRPRPALESLQIGNVTVAFYHRPRHVILVLYLTIVLTLRNT